MQPDADQAIVILVTAGNYDEAERLARLLVENRLVACTSLIPGIESIYRWQGSVVKETEILLICKTVRGRYKDVERAVLQSHSYENPEVIALPVESGSASYLQWLLKSVSTEVEE